MKQLLAWAFFCLPSLASGFWEIPAEKRPKIPLYVYIWMGEKEIDAWARGLEVGKKLQLPSLKGREDGMLAEQVGVYRQAAGIGGWSNPVTGMMVNPEALPYFPKKEYGTRLVRFQIRQNVTAAFVGSRVEGRKAWGWRTSPSKPAGVLVYYTLYQEHNVIPLYKQWVIVDPSAIESFTADPVVLFQDLRGSIVRIESGISTKSMSIFAHHEIHGFFMGPFVSTKRDSDVYLDTFQNYEKLQAHVLPRLKAYEVGTPSLPEGMQHGSWRVGLKGELSR